MAEPAMIPVRRPDEGPVEGGELRVVGKVVAICHNQLNIHTAKLMGNILTVVGWPSMVVMTEDVIVVSDSVVESDGVGVLEDGVNDASVLEDDAEVKVEVEVGDEVVEEIADELPVDDDVGLIDDAEVDDGVVDELDGVLALELFADLQQYQVQNLKRSKKSNRGRVVHLTQKASASKIGGKKSASVASPSHSK